MSLNIENISYNINGKNLLQDISFSVERGKIHGLLGPNGAGKTTLFSIIMGLVKPNQGRITLDTATITSFAPHQRVQQGLSFLPQETCLFEDLSVLDNILIALETQNFGTKSQMIDKSMLVLSELNIKNLAHKKCHLLSGGQKRRCEFARLIACQPCYALLDEPFAGVDPISIADIQQQISLLCKKNIGVVISDHHVAETLKICDLATVMYAGEILLTDYPEKVLDHDLVKKNYLGA